MISYQIKAGTVDVSVVIRIVDSTDGTPETGVVFNTSGIDLEYRREGAASTDITEATLAALTTAHTDGGFLHIGNGYYRLDLPDAACATGVPGVLVHGTVTGMVVIGCYIQLIVNTEEDVYTRIGAPAGASVSADIAAIEAQTDDIGAAGAGLTAITNLLPAALVGGRIDASVGAMAANVLTATAINADAITAAKLAADVTTELQSGLATAAALDTVDNFLDTEVAAILAAVDTEVAAIITTLGTPAGASVSADIAAVKAQTAAIETDTAEIGAAGAGLTVLATQASVNTIDDFLDTEVAAIKAKTDSLTFTTAGIVDANVQQINDVTITGNGQVGTEFGVA